MDFSNKFGISQGRLTHNPKGLLQHFPQENWEEEFKIASSVGLSFIELLTERDFNSKNPVWSDKGRNTIRSIAKSNNLEIYSICADYIIDHSFSNINADDTIDMMKSLFKASEELSCKMIILPFLEENNITKDNLNKYVSIIQNLSELNKNEKTILAIESLLEARDLRKLIEKVNKKNVRCVFDTGNRVNFRQDLYDEILILDDLISHVHIKDKNSNDTNVILGTGLVNFNSVFSALSKIKYRGNYNFETTRGNNPLRTATYHLNLCKFFKEENFDK